LPVASGPVLPVARHRSAGDQVRARLTGSRTHRLRLERRRTSAMADAVPSYEGRRCPYSGRRGHRVRRFGTRKNAAAVVADSSKKAKANLILRRDPSIDSFLVISIGQLLSAGQADAADHEPSAGPCLWPATSWIERAEIVGNNRPVAMRPDQSFGRNYPNGRPRAGLSRMRDHGPRAGPRG